MPWRRLGEPFRGLAHPLGAPLGGGIPTKAPNLVAGLTGWWDAGDPTTMYIDAGVTLVSADGQAVQRLADKSGNARHLNQANVGTKPLYKVNRQNGKSGLLFDGTDDLMNSVAISNFIANNAYTLFVVCKPISIGTNDAATYANDSPFCDLSGYFGVFLKSVPTVHLFNWDGTDDKTTHATIAVGTAFLFAGRHSSGNIVSSVNGGTENTVASGNTADLTATLKIASGVGAGTFANIDWYEAAIYNTVVSADERTLLTNYFKQKWGIS